MNTVCKSCGVSATLQCGGCKNTYYCGKSCQVRNFKTHQQFCGSQLMLIQGKRGRETTHNVANAMAEIVDEEDVSLLMFEQYFLDKKKVYALLNLQEEDLPFFAFYTLFQQVIAKEHFARDIVRSEYTVEMGQQIDSMSDTTRYVFYLPGKTEMETYWEYMSRHKDVLL